MDITPLLSYLRSTSNLALSCKGFAWRVSSNGFPIQTSESDLCLENFSFYKLLDYPGIDKWTIDEFYDVIMKDDCNRLKLLLDGGANIEAKNYHGCTPLILAAMCSKVKCLELLLENKANIKAKSAYRNTALDLAASEGRTNCLKLLLEHGAQVSPKIREEYPRYAHLWGDSSF